MADRLTRKQRGEATDYVAELQENLRLGLWRIDIAPRFTKKKHNAHARIQIHDQAHEATISVAADLHRESRATQRRIMVHELCHLMLVPIEWAVDRNSKPLGKGNQANDNIAPAIEMSTDDVAFLLAEHQPLPPKGWLR